MREYLESGHVDFLWWLDILAMFADGMTKGSVDREALVAVCQKGVWNVVGQAPQCKSLKDSEEPTEATTTSTKSGQQ